VIFMYELLLFVLFLKIFFSDKYLFCVFLIFITKNFCPISCINDKMCPVFSYVPMINICHVIFLYLFVINICLVFYYSSQINISSFNKTNKYLLCISFISMSNCFWVFFFNIYRRLYLSHLSMKFIVCRWLLSRVTHLRVIRGFNVRNLLFFLKINCVRNWYSTFIIIITFFNKIIKITLLKEDHSLTIFK